MTDGDNRASLRAVLGVLGVTCLQVVLALGVAWVKLHTTAHWFTILIPAILVLAGFAHFRVLSVVAIRPMLKGGLVVLATLSSAYWMMFALLNTFGS